MSPNTVDAITAAWNCISADQQRQLIYQFINNYGGSMPEGWMGFLASEFEVHETGAAGCGFDPDGRC